MTMLGTIMPITTMSMATNARGMTTLTTMTIMAMRTRMSILGIRIAMM